jgi:hypothetical protein
MGAFDFKSQALPEFEAVDPLFVTMMSRKQWPRKLTCGAMAQ